MFASQFGSYTQMEFRLLLREPLALFFTLVFPVLLLLIFGSIWGNTPIPRYGNLGYITLSLPGFIAMVIATSGMLTLSATVASYREIGFFRVLRTTPVTPFTVLTGQFTSLFGATAVSIAVLLIVARAVYTAAFPVHIAFVLPAFLASCAALFSLGFLLGNILASVRTTQITSMALFFPMLFLCGAALPTDILPHGMQTFSHFLPLTQAVNLHRWAWFGGVGSQVLRDALALGVFCILNIIFSYRAFRADSEHPSPAAKRAVSVTVYLGLWSATIALLYFT